MDIKRGQIHFADLSPVVGSEQGGYRPVLVIQNDKGNGHSPTTIVAAITSSRQKPNLPTHIIVEAPGLIKRSVVLLEQIRTVDKARLAEYIGCLDNISMRLVDKAIAVSFGLSYPESDQHDL